MPLVVPGLMGGNSNDNKDTQKWQQELMGKKLGEQSDNMTFAKKDLPQQHRIVKGDSMMTMDFQQDR